MCIHLSPTRQITHRHSTFQGFGLALMVFLAAGCSDSITPPEQPLPDEGLVLTQVFSGLDALVYLTAVPGDSRIFIVEQRGIIRIANNGQLLPEPFLDIRAEVRFQGEQGLLSMAFHPNYSANGFFYVNFTDNEGRTVIRRFSRGNQADSADPQSGFTILNVDQPFGNHNGGQLQFDATGALLIGMGDGGSGGDPQGHGQNPQTLLGAMLRLDIDGGSPYAIPSNNPFVNGGGRPEIWATGLRNPWRFSIDFTDNALYIADVGQDLLEEINVTDATTPGINYGWSINEGSQCFDGPCGTSGLTPPAYEYGPGDGCSITGGYVYRGTAIPGLRGHYLYADYCSGWVESFRYSSGEVRDKTRWFTDVGNITSFGQDGAGEIYILTSGGRIYRVDAA